MIASRRAGVSKTCIDGSAPVARTTHFLFARVSHNNSTSIIHKVEFHTIVVAIHQSREATITGPARGPALHRIDRATRGERSERRAHREPLRVVRRDLCGNQPVRSG